MSRQRLDAGPSEARARAIGQLLAYPPDHADQQRATHHVTVPGKPGRDLLWVELARAFKVRRQSIRDCP